MLKDFLNRRISSVSPSLSLSTQIRDSFVLYRSSEGKDTYCKKIEFKITKNSEDYINIIEYFKKQGFNYTEYSTVLAENYPFFTLYKNKELITIIQLHLILDECTACLTGDEQSVEDSIEYFKKYIKNNNFSLIKQYLNPAADSKQSFSVVTKHLYKEGNNVAKQCFYPNIKIPLENYYSNFMKSKENILVLIGPPGTGKSTFIRSLILSNYYKTMLTYSKLIIESEILINNFYSSDFNLLILEDVDDYLKPRENKNSLMSTFLNTTEGIIKDETKKIVFSTNLSNINNVDPALIRRGRCYDVIKFDLLTIDQARVIEEEMNIAYQDLSSKSKWSLSEILNPINNNLQMTRRDIVHTGFTN